MHRIAALLLIILTVGGVALILYTTEIGPWAYSDSAAYLVTAKNINAGRGIVLQNPAGEFELIPLHPPLFPLAVSLPMALSVSALQSSRWLNAILFGLTIFLAGWSTFTFTRSYWLAGGAAGLILLSYAPVRAYSGAMSEGLFLFLAFSSLFLLTYALTGRLHSIRWMALAGVLSGLAILARYTGLALLAVGPLVILVCGGPAVKPRLKQILAFLAPGIFFPALWAVPVYLSTRTFGNRPLGDLTNILPKFRQYFQSFMDVVGSWLPFFYRGNHILSPTWKLILAGTIGIGLIIAAYVVLRRRKQALNENGALTWGLALFAFIAAYVALHLGTYITAFTQPDVDERLLLPIFIASTLLIPVIFAFTSRLIKPRWLGGIAFAALALITAWYFHGKLLDYLFLMNHYGVGYTSKRWNENPIFDQIAALDANQQLSSNDPGLVLFYTGRFPDNIERNTMPNTHDMDLPADHGLVLFNLEGQQALGSAYDSILTTARERYQIYYEDNEGIVFLPRK
ncbi:MAG: ArnT family glycosyltransferase [Bellilinea sp.]